MVRALGDLREAHVVEVGAGPGSLTRSLLLAGARRVIAIEKDRRFMPALELLADAADGRLCIVHGDALHVDYDDLLRDAPQQAWDTGQPPGAGPVSVAVAGNLPFAISTPLLLRFLRMARTQSGPFARGRAPMLLTFQKELADRLVASPGSPQRARISVMAQHVCSVRIVQQLPSSVFVPRPAVDASAVLLQPLVTPRAAAPFLDLELVARGLFVARRKTLRNALMYDAVPRQWRLAVGMRCVRSRVHVAPRPPDAAVDSGLVRCHPVRSDVDDAAVAESLCKQAGLDPAIRPQTLDIPALDALTCAYAAWRASTVPDAGRRDRVARRSDR